MNDVKITARGSGRLGTDYLIVSVVDGGRSRNLAIRRSELNTNETMVALGILTNAARTDFLRAAEAALRDLQPTLIVIDQCGLHPNAFLWPTREVSGDGRVLVALPPDSADGWSRLRGSLRQWRQISWLALGNSRLMLALALSLEGPVIEFLGSEAAMINLVSAAGAFKSTALDVASAVWGVDRRSWHGTANGVEAVALRHNGCFLAIDDLRPPSDRKRSEAAEYLAMRDGIIRLADRRSKERKGEASGTFRLPILSASNATMDERARRLGVALDADQAALRGRLIEVPLSGPHRDLLFEALHGREDADALAVELGDLAVANMGVAADAFVGRFLAARRADADGLRTRLLRWRGQYVRWAKARFGDRPGYKLFRLHMKMGTIYATGCLGIEFGIFPWQQQALGWAVATCEAAHLALFDAVVLGDTSVVAQATQSPLDALRRHVRCERRRFVDLRRTRLDAARHDHDRCPGYLNRGPNGELELLFADAMLERVSGSRTRLATLKRELADHGSLRRGERRVSVKRTIYDTGRREDREQVIAVCAADFA